MGAELLGNSIYKCSNGRINVIYNDTIETLTESFIKSNHVILIASYVIITPHQHTVIP